MTKDRLSACRDESAKYEPNELFTADQIAFLDEVADTILPETKTPGAKAAKVGPFMLKRKDAVS